MYSYYNIIIAFLNLFLLFIKFFTDTSSTFYYSYLNNNNDIIPYKSRPMRRYLGKIGALYFISYIQITST